MAHAAFTQAACCVDVDIPMTSPEIRSEREQAIEEGVN